MNLSQVSALAPVDLQYIGSMQISSIVMPSEN